EATFRGSTTTAAGGSPWCGPEERRADPGTPEARRRAARPPRSARSRRVPSCRSALPEVGTDARVGIDGCVHLTQTAMQTRLRRTEGNADRRCDIGQREVEVVVQDDERPRFRLELRKGALELVAVDDRRRAVRDGRRGDRIDPDVESVSAETARFVDARSNDEAPCPGVEAIRIPKGGQITPDPDERVLDGVLSLFGVTEDEVGDGSQLGDRGACQLSE